MTDHRTQTLVAIDWDGGTDIAPVLDRLGVAVSHYVITTISTTSNGQPVEKTAHRIRFNTAVIRNTEAHGIAYRAGFVSHIE